jgi:hypothetical protein
MQEIETSEHILLQCVVAREVWHICRELLDLSFEEPNRDSTFGGSRSMLGFMARKERSSMH